MAVIPKLNTNQLGRLSEVLGNISLLFFATFVLPFFIKSENFEFSKAIVGLVATIIFLALSVIILKEDKYE